MNLVFSAGLLFRRKLEVNRRVCTVAYTTYPGCALNYWWNVHCSQQLFRSENRAKNARKRWRPTIL